MTDKLICPYCGSTNNEHRSVGYDDDCLLCSGILATCNECKKKFQFYVTYVEDYDSWKTDCLNGAQHVWGIDKGLLGSVSVKCKICGEYKQDKIHRAITYNKDKHLYSIRYCTVYMEISDNIPEEELMIEFDNIAEQLKTHYELTENN